MRLEQVDDRAGAAVAGGATVAAGEAGDAAIAAGQKVGPLAGVPFAVKNLFDIEGVRTLAGSKINRRSPPSFIISSVRWPCC